MIGFRVDANEKIATGHMMRCIAIATECRRRGIECLFILAEKKETQRLEERGFQYHVLDTVWDNMDTEKDKMKQLIFDMELEWIVVDSYQATDSYLTFLNQFVSVLYVDDMAEECYHVSALLHYSQWPEETLYQQNYINSRTELLVGMKYAPLRGEFHSDVIKKERQNNILITTGGTDTYNVTGKVLESLLKSSDFADFKFYAVIGSMNKNRKSLVKLKERDRRIFLYENVKNMAEIMKKCRYAVSAGGTTLYELCACGIPTVCFSFADNQEMFTAEMGHRRIMLYAGDARRTENIGDEIVDRLDHFLRCPGDEVSYGERMKQLVDGNGTKRIVDFLEKNGK